MTPNLNAQTKAPLRKSSNHGERYAVPVFLAGLLDASFVSPIELRQAFRCATPPLAPGNHAPKICRFNAAFGVRG
jgi:hypothetical protein